MASNSLDAEKIESKQEERTIDLHQIDSINLLIFTTLLVIVVLTIWICKRRNFRYLHETCLALVYGKLLPPQEKMYNFSFR
jgi:sodium/hydrogen exchanger-like protein 6/7